LKNLCSSNPIMLLNTFRRAITTAAPVVCQRVCASQVVSIVAPSQFRKFSTIPAICSTPSTHLQASSSSSPASSSSSSPSSSYQDFDSEIKCGYDSPPQVLEETMIQPSEQSKIDPTGRAFTYLVQGTAAFAYATAARAAVHQFVGFWAASADVLALSTLEVDIGKIEEGRTQTVKWRGKPVFIRHRNRKEIEAARADDSQKLRDQQSDSSRVQKPEWVIVIGVCTHLGCVPLAGDGDWKGWFCPCHGSHYDTSGRIRKGPAPLNLEVPTYKFLTDSKVLLG